MTRMKPKNLIRLEHRAARWKCIAQEKTAERYQKRYQVLAERYQ